MELATFNVHGTTPLMLNNPQGMYRDPNAPKTRRSIPTPTEEAELGCYKNAKGDLCLPSMAFRKVVLNAAKGLKVGRVGLTGILAGAVFPYDEWTDIVDAKGKGIGTYTIDTRRAVPPGQGAVMRSRPRIEEWWATVRLEYDADFADRTTLYDLLAKGGRTIGVGSYRPERGGIFGRFEVT